MESCLYTVQTDINIQNTKDVLAIIVDLRYNTLNDYCKLYADNH